MNVNFEKVSVIKIINRDRREIDAFEITGSMLEKPGGILTLQRRIDCYRNSENVTATDVWKNAKLMSLEEFKVFYQEITRTAPGGSGGIEMKTLKVIQDKKIFVEQELIRINKLFENNSDLSEMDKFVFKDGTQHTEWTLHDAIVSYVAQLSILNWILDNSKV